MAPQIEEIYGVIQRILESLTFTDRKIGDPATPQFCSPARVQIVIPQGVEISPPLIPKRNPNRHPSTP